MMHKHLRYAKYLCRHKWYVFLAACKLGIPWLGVIHDLSKLLPSEWEGYAEFFYGGAHRPWAQVSAYEKTYYPSAWDRSQEGVQAALDVAWLHHQKRNKHHWQYWLLTFDSGETRPLWMPDRYRREMLADWVGAGRALGKPDTLAWYIANRDKMQLHPETRAWIEERLRYGRQ